MDERPFRNFRAAAAINIVLVRARKFDRLLQFKTRLIACRPIISITLNGLDAQDILAD